MHYNDIVGTIGVGLILIAYFCNTFKLLPENGRVFFLLNTIGAGLACYASLLISFWPFIILEGVWCIVSVIGLLKTFRINHVVK